ncbi:MAG: branched-chain amino acid ABC transporter permease [Burkholderiales bacterium]|nr:branched-chain amino acid ABC transporter permease [Burkholderiales bacterium]MCE7877568.1 branched-chain amino acid ABC transporter permease [Betaproteobacteria bacterium PRO3]
MDTFLQQLVNGLTLGSVYAVVALGYTMVYGIIQLINFAHGEVVMIGAMTAYSVIVALTGAQVPLPAVAIVLLGAMAAIPVCMAIGYTLERTAYRPLRNAPRLAPLITAIGLSIILQHLAMLVWSRNPLSYPQIIKQVPIHLTANPDGATITNVQVAIIVTSIAMMAGLLALVYRTKFGIAMRAVAQNPSIAGLMGIDINRIIALTFVVGAGLGAVAGVMVGSYYGIAHYQMGALLGLKAFSAAVLGGIGNLAGAMLGGVLLGVIEALGAGYVGELTNLCRLSGWFDALAQRCASDPNVTLFGSNYQDVFAFIVLILVLVFRPSGLLGERVSDRA